MDISKDESSSVVNRFTISISELEEARQEFNSKLDAKVFNKKKKK